MGRKHMQSLWTQVDGKQMSASDPHQYEDHYDEADEGPNTCDLCDLAIEDCTCDECGLMADGTCMLAGTEFCDWSCKSRRT